MDFTSTSPDGDAGVFSLTQIRHLMRVEFSRAQRYGYPVSCLVCGIDRIENLRDLYGYEFRESVLVEVVDLLQSEPDKNIRIEGHTDSVGDADTNLEISQQRANAVYEALVSLGVAADRVTTMGMGEDFPIATNDTEEGRAQNRRVDVILLDE